MGLPAHLRIKTWKGATWRVQLTWYDDDAQADPHDLTGYTARFTIYDRRASKLVELTELDGITLGGVEGTMILTMETEEFTWKEGAYELVVTDATGIDTALIEGSFVLDWVNR